MYGKSPREWLGRGRGRESARQAGLGDGSDSAEVAGLEVQIPQATPSAGLWRVQAGAVYGRSWAAWGQTLITWMQWAGKRHSAQPRFRSQAGESPSEKAPSHWCCLALAKARSPPPASYPASSCRPRPACLSDCRSSTASRGCRRGSPCGRRLGNPEDRLECVLPAVERKDGYERCEVTGRTKVQTGPALAFEKIR